MINTTHLLKVGAAWITIVFLVCFFGVLFFPNLRYYFPLYGLHMMVPMGANALTLTTFISGLLIWNIIVCIGLWLFAALYNTFKK
jgi:hypothetical protein